MYKLILPKAYPQTGKFVLNGREFENGQCVLNDADAMLVIPVFKSFYGAKAEKVAEPEDDSPKGLVDPSLKSGQTKGG